MLQCSGASRAEVLSFNSEASHFPPIFDNIRINVHYEVHSSLTSDNVSGYCVEFHIWVKLKLAAVKCNCRKEVSVEQTLETPMAAVKRLFEVCISRINPSIPSSTLKANTIMTALHKCAQSGDMDKLVEHLEFGSSIDAKDPDHV